MKFAYFITLFIVSAQNVEPQTLNFTIPEDLLVNLTNFIIENAGNQSITFGDILFSDVVQEALEIYGYGDVAAAINSLDQSLAAFNQLGQIQSVIDQLAGIDDACFHQLALFVGDLNKMEEWAVESKYKFAKILTIRLNIFVVKLITYYNHFESLEAILRLIDLHYTQ